MTTDIAQISGWATSGTKTAPSSGLSISGWTGGAQPAAENSNYLMDEERDKANELVDEVNDINDADGPGFAHGYPQEVLSTKLYNTDGAETQNAYEYSNTGDTGDFIDLAVYSDPDGAVKLMALDSTDGTPVVNVYDAELLEARKSPNSTSGDLSGDLPSGSSQSWQATSFCTDGTSVYAIFQDTNVNPNETHQIQAWDIDGWTVKSGWPSSGVTLPGTGTVDITEYESAVEVVSPTQLATANSWFGTVTASTDAAVTIITLADGTIEASGAGDHPLSLPSINRISSSGAYLFCTGVNSTYICSVQIAGPASGSGPAETPYSPGGFVSDVCNTGLLITASAGEVFHFGHASWGEIGKAESVEYGIYRRGGSIAFDGIYHWTLGEVVRGTAGRPVVFRIDTGVATCQSASVTTDSTRLVHYVKATVPYSPYTTYNEDDIMAPIVFDGRNIWFYDGTRILRIPRATIR